MRGFALTRGSSSTARLRVRYRARRGLATVQGQTIAGTLFLRTASSVGSGAARSRPRCVMAVVTVVTVWSSDGLT